MSRPFAATAASALRPEMSWRPVDLGPLDLLIETGRNGETYVSSPFALAYYDANATAWLDLWAARAPERIFLADRPSGEPRQDWQTLTYANARQRARTLAQRLLTCGLSAARPLVILSGNSIAHALLGLAALYAGIPYAPL